MQNILLDTHALLWFDQEPERFSPRVKKALRRKSATIFVSPVSLYELQRKLEIGKLPQAARLLENIDRRMVDYDFRFLPITARHAIVAARLDWDHRDPFDRLLVAQATEENCTIVSADQRFSQAGIHVMW
ncbi:MAG: type II toxin-antitoxin system VapC family toxin [Candidatus Kapabacteria bacterium]|nr:type II toxin-antitoxin system VapC family toxin [Ignavibacteria bacterium]MBP6509511.1 type II toxin-antitoxin system VapC family toxin [Candidatus Kapabacteria bacterium]